MGSSQSAPAKNGNTQGNAGVTSQPGDAADSTDRSSENELAATLEEQKRLHRHMEDELARRKAAEAQATLQRQEQELKVIREKERLRLEEERQREMLEMQARRARDEEQRKVEEARARRELEQELKVMQEQQRLRLEEERRHEMLEMQARRARDEEQRKAEEIRAKEVLEQKHKAVQEQQRLRLEKERRHEKLEMLARRAQEHKEELRKAEEVRAKQQLEQELRAIKELEKLRFEEERQLQILAVQARQEREEQLRKAEEDRAKQEEEELKAMSSVCRRHNSPQGCADPDCRRLHICRLFLVNICKHGMACRKGHSLTTVHNQMICSKNNLDAVQESLLIGKLRLAFKKHDDLPENIYVNNLETCHNFCSRSSCHQNECNRIHICRHFITGVCPDGASCQFEHDLHTSHNNGVLDRHRVTDRSDNEILHILRRKEESSGKRVDGATSGISDARSGAIPRYPSSGVGNQPRHPRQPSQPSQPRHPSQPSQPRQPRQSPHGLSAELQCPVCLEMFCRAITLGCGHTFCAECLHNVCTRLGDRCPVCRAHISSAIRSVTLDNIIRSMSRMSMSRMQ